MTATKHCGQCTNGEGCVEGYSQSLAFDLCHHPVFPTAQEKTYNEHVVRKVTSEVLASTHAWPYMDQLDPANANSPHLPLPTDQSAFLRLCPRPFLQRNESGWAMMLTPFEGSILPDLPTKIIGQSRRIDEPMGDRTPAINSVIVAYDIGNVNGQKLNAWCEELLVFFGTPDDGVSDPLAQWDRYRRKTRRAVLDRLWHIYKTKRPMLGDELIDITALGQLDKRYMDRTNGDIYALRNATGEYMYISGSREP